MLEHPGRYLEREYLIPLGIAPTKFSYMSKIPAHIITGIVRGTKDITAEVAIRLSYILENPPEWWMQKQLDFDLERARLKVNVHGMRSLLLQQAS